MRVIAGQYKSRPLRALPGARTRPTSDRLRETLFNVLTAGNPDALAGSRWLDLFAGTGAVGIEALSRGAAHVTFVDSAKAAARVIRENLKSLGITEGFAIVENDVTRALRDPALSAMEVRYVFVDPPYAEHQQYADTLRALGESQILSADAVVIVEHDKRFDPGDEFERLQRSRTLGQGDSRLSFYRLT